MLAFSYHLVPSLSPRLRTPPSFSLWPSLMALRFCLIIVVTLSPLLDWNFFKTEILTFIPSQVPCLESQHVDRCLPWTPNLAYFVLSPKGNHVRACGQKSSSPSERTRPGGLTSSHGPVTEFLPAKLCCSWEQCLWARALGWISGFRSWLCHREAG